MERKSSTFSRAGFKEVSGAQEQNHGSGFSSSFHHKEMKEKAWEPERLSEETGFPLRVREVGSPRNSHITFRGVCKKGRLAF